MNKSGRRKTALLKKAALFCACLLTMQTACALTAFTPAAEEPEELPVILRAVDGRLGGKATVNGSKVGNLGKSGTNTEGTVTFENLPVGDGGAYFLLVCYASGSDDRYFDLKSDGGSARLLCPSTGSFDTVGSIGVSVNLTKGGSLTFGSDWYAPDLFYVEIYRSESDVFPARAYEDADDHVWSTDGISVIYDLHNGVFSAVKNGRTVLENARAEFVLNGKTIGSDEFEKHICVSAGEDALILRHEGHPDFDGCLEQRFCPAGEGALQTCAIARGENGRELAVNRIAPLSAARESVKIDNAVFVRIPFDNDMWEEPRHTPAALSCSKTTSYEAAALYDAQSKDALIVGSLTHDLWKTAIGMLAHGGEVRGLTVCCGAADGGTRDLCPHGEVRGAQVSSAEIYIGVFDDWRAGFTAFGQANARTAAPAESDGYVPFGFNSWGSMQSGVSYGAMIAVSDYIKNNFQDVWSEGGNPVYINIDSYWDYLARNDPSFTGTNREALAAFAAHCSENGQSAGIYFTPFAVWLDDENALKNTAIAGTAYTYYDAALKKYDGSLYGKLDGGWALDPTHPGTVARFENALRDFIDLGFSYVKLDFLTHGALEGKHYDERVFTGMQAYNAAMEKIAGICAGKMFVNLSIAPVFPYQYAQGRRISCDAFASLDNTMHVLSYLTSCFWFDEIYAFPDPDHLVVSGVSEGTARCRVTAGVICGTSFLVGEDLSKVRAGSAAQRRLDALFGNRGVLEAAKTGKSFTPLEVRPGSRCADAYILRDGDAVYLAVFNFEKSPVSRTFDVGFLTGGNFPVLRASELWSGEKIDISGGTLRVTVGAQDAALIRLDRGSSPAIGEAPFGVGAFVAYALLSD